MNSILTVIVAAIGVILGMFLINRVAGFIKDWIDEAYAKEASTVALLIIIIVSCVIAVTML